ncbi:GDP-Man:Man3GlcNAc2-PP-dolichol alpha-1,2-mannosyltransferase [Malassezia cuniculi]|uniref:GDP-Man:Man3GlcNAc2-PP-dolichol alpha-1,2-mannosyltransferase n=1 Tax=Malassezia cuniculi TaxID=948313 RepID=A0AAF0F153_9BASI|nr:GDP-Man:Man3GlcNAc2-PP-dolichol alpha-1,2-mannosyltransferase [Malassezia cuniculi]
MEQRDAIKARAHMREVRVANQIGYREGVEAGKLETLQAGFDDGYNNGGVAIGSTVGEMRGTAAALQGAVDLGMLKTDSDTVQALRDIIADLDKLDPSTLFAPDPEEIDHDAEHHDHAASVNVAELRAVTSIGYVGVLVALAAFAPRLLGASSQPLSKQLLVFWLAIDALIHVFRAGFFAEVWQEYSKADSRWGVADPGVVSVEILTVVLGGPLAAYAAYLVARGDQRYYLYVVVLCTAELYGDFVRGC